MSELEPPPQHPPDPAASPGNSSSFGIIIFLFLVVAACAGVLVFFLNPSKKEAAVADGGMFDIQELPETKTPPAAPASAAVSAPSPSSLSMAGTLAPLKPMEAAPSAQKPAAPSGARAAFIDAVRRAEGKMRALAEAYTKKYPVIEKYGEEWMKNPGLKKLNDDYMENHDPVQFMRGLAQSKEFPVLVKKYAHESVIQAFVKDAVMKAPGDVMKAGTGYIKEDPLVKNLVNTVMTSLGLPAGMLGGAEGGPKVGSAEVVDSLKKSNPQLEQLLNNPEAQKLMQDQGKDKKP